MLIRIYRHPVAEATAPAAAETQGAAAAPEKGAAAASTKTPAATDAPQESAQTTTKPAAAPASTDWQAYQKMQEKFRKNPNARASKAEVALAQKYEGKDENTIEGYVAEGQPPPAAPEKAATEPAPETKEAAKPEPPAIPKELESLVGDKSPVGAKTLADLPAAVEKLVKSQESLNGEMGRVGRLMNKMGAQNMKEATDFADNAWRLHRLVQDAKAGKPEALQYLKLNTAPAAKAPAPGEVPEGVVDDVTYRHLSGENKALRTEIEDLKARLDGRFSDVDAWKKAEAKRQANEIRTAQINDISTEVGTLTQLEPALWDAKQHGSLNVALLEYYNSPEGSAYNPGLKSIIEILDLAKQHKIDDLDIALSHWKRKNQGNILQKTMEKAREPFLGKQPSVGMSDAQDNRSGQFKEFTKTQLLNMGKPGYPKIPKEWVDEVGTFVPESMPPYARSVLLGEETEE